MYSKKGSNTDKCLLLVQQVSSDPEASGLHISPISLTPHLSIIYIPHNLLLRSDHYLLLIKIYFWLDSDLEAFSKDSLCLLAISFWTLTLASFIFLGKI